jgi:hypothetical protein
MGKDANFIVNVSFVGEKLSRITRLGRRNCKQERDVKISIKG